MLQKWAQPSFTYCRSVISSSHLSVLRGTQSSRNAEAYPKKGKEREEEGGGGGGANVKGGGGCGAAAERREEERSQRGNRLPTIKHCTWNTVPDPDLMVEALSPAYDGLMAEDIFYILFYLWISFCTLYASVRFICFWKHFSNIRAGRYYKLWAQWGHIQTHLLQLTLRKQQQHIHLSHSM